MKPGDKVRVTSRGVSVFVIKEIDGDVALIESVEDAPGIYPWPCPLSGLTAVDGEQASQLL